MPLDELSDKLDLKRAAHLLRRATFGATKDQIDDFANLTPRQAIGELFGATLPDPVVPIDPETGTEWVLTGPTDANSDDLDGVLKKWFIGQMLSAGVATNLSLAYSARERIVFFLHSHFTTIASKVNNSRSLYFQNQLFRMFALDQASGDPDINFKTLTVKVSVDNAMLRLLDGNLNMKGSVNENYARELLELYSIGRGLEGSQGPTQEQGDYGVYKEADVQAAAKVLSGWDIDDTYSWIDTDTNLPRGVVRGSATNASAHDNTVKQFSSHFAGASITPDPTLLQGGNPTEESALDEIEQLIDMIYARQETVKNICWKIYRFFVYAPHTPAEMQALDGTIIAQMAQVFTDSGFKIQPVIENLLCSEHFYEATDPTVKDDNFGGIIKSPLDLVVPALRFFEVPVPDMTADTAGFYDLTGYVLDLVEGQAMKYYEPYDVAGYDAYHQFPVYHRYWITPNTLANRYNFIREFFAMGAGMEMKYKPNLFEFVKKHFAAEAPDARELTKAITHYLLPVTDNLTFDDAADDNSGLTAKRLNYFKSRFLQSISLDDESYWTTRWTSVAGDLDEQLVYLFNIILQSPEYQLA